MSKKSHEDQIWDHVVRFVEALEVDGIPREAVPPVVADFLTLSAIALGLASGESARVVEALIQRQHNMLEAWRKDEPPFDEINIKPSTTIH